MEHPARVDDVAQAEVVFLDLETAYERNWPTCADSRVLDIVFRESKRDEMRLFYARDGSDHMLATSSIGNVPEVQFHIPLARPTKAAMLGAKGPGMPRACRWTSGQ